MFKIWRILHNSLSSQNKNTDVEPQYQLKDMNLRNIAFFECDIGMSF